MPMASMQA